MLRLFTQYFPVLVTLDLSGASLDRSLDARSLSLDFLSTSRLSLLLLVSRSLDADSLLREVEFLFDGDSAIEIFVRPLVELTFATFSVLPSRSTDEPFGGAGLVFVNSDVGAGFFVT